MKTYPQYIRKDLIEKAPLWPYFVAAFLVVVLSCALGYTTSEYVKLSDKLDAQCTQKATTKPHASKQPSLDRLFTKYADNAPAKNLEARYAYDPRLVMLLPKLTVKGILKNKP